jgi:hypothetical protein
LAEYTAGVDGFDVVLRSKDETTEVPLKLFQQSRELPGGYRSEFDPLRAEQIADSQISHATQTPEAGLTWAERSWHSGAGQVYHADAIGRDTGPDLERYAHSDGVLAMFPGKAVLGYQEDWADTTLQNGRATSVGAYANTACLLDEALDTSETAINVDDGDYFFAGDIIKVGAEKMKVVSVATNTLTVVRGVAGTKGISHSNNAVIQMPVATGWDDNSNITDVFISADSKTGDYGIKFKTSAAGYLGQRYKGTDAALEAPIGTYNVTLTFGVYAKRVAGSGTLSPRITTSAGDLVTGTGIDSESFAYGSASQNLPNGFTTLDFRLSGSAANDVWVVDDMFVIITGCNSEWTKMVRFKGSNASHEFYTASGGAIFKWDETDDVFYVVHMSDADGITSGTPDPFTDLEVFDDEGTSSFLLAGRNGTATDNDNHYMRSADGATFSAPTSATGNASKAEFFLKTRNSLGDTALIKSRFNKVALAANASNTANWGGEIKVGDVDTAITGMFSVNDRAYVGKEDGLWVYDEVTNVFKEIEPDANFFAHPDNYSRAIGRGGSIWARGGDHSLFRVDPIDDNNNFAWNDVSDLVSFPEWSGFSAGARALAQDRHSVWIALDGADKQIIKSQILVPPTVESVEASSEGGNISWVGAGGSLSGSTEAREDSRTALWADTAGLSPAGTNSDILKFTMEANTFSLPANAVPTGVTIRMRQGFLFGGLPLMNSIKLVKADSAMDASEKAETAREPFSEIIIGGPADTWGLSFTKDGGGGDLTPTDFANANFGFQIQMETTAEHFAAHQFGYAEVQVSYAEAGSDRSRIVTLRQDGQKFVPHTISNVQLENPDRLARMYDTANTQSSLFVLGRTNNSDASADELRAIRMRIPVGNQDPSALEVPEHRRTGAIYTPWMDNFFPDVPKGALKLTLITRNCEPNRRNITVSYKTDNADNDDSAGWNPWGDGGSTNDGIFDSDSGKETQAANIGSPLSYNRIRLNFEFVTDDPTSSPELLGFVLTSSWVPDRVNSKRWVLICDMSSGTRTEMNTESIDQIISKLETLAGEAFITMEEFRGDGDDSVATHTVQLVNIRDEYERQEIAGSPQGATQHHTLRLQLARQNTA